MPAPLNISLIVALFEILKRTAVLCVSFLLFALNTTIVLYKATFDCLHFSVKEFIYLQVFLDLFLVFIIETKYVRMGMHICDLAKRKKVIDMAFKI
jgi:hypothetical protein